MRIRTVLATLLASALFWWFVRGTDVGEIRAAVQHADIPLLAAALAIVAVTYVARAVRWQCLLQPVGPTRFRSAFRTTVIGFAALSVLPARVGDLLRPYLLAQQERLSLPATFATVVMERVLDLLTVVVLLAVYVWVTADPAAMPAEAAGEMAVVKASAAMFGAAALGLLGVMWVLATHPERIGAFVGALRVLPQALASRLARLVSGFGDGFAVSRSPRALVVALAWSFPIWLATAVEAWVVTRAFGLDLPVTGSFLVQALLVLGVAVPTPAGVGSYHAAYRYAMVTFFGAPEALAVAAAIVLHLISFFPVVIVGLVFMAQDGLSMGRLRRMAGEAREKERSESDEVPILRTSRR